MAADSSVVMFFSPYAGIWLHAMPEALVASALGRQGVNVVYAVCDGMYSDGCYVMSAYGVSGDSGVAVRNRVCRHCRKQRDLLIKNLDCQVVVVDALLDSQSSEKIHSIMNEVSLGNIETFEYEGVPVGRYAIHETILHHKITALSELTDDSLRDFFLKLKHVLMTYFVGKKLLEQISPNRVVAYNTHISTNYTLMKMAEGRGVPTFGLHAGGNMSDRLATLYVFRQDMVVLYRNWMQQFMQKWSALPVNASCIRNATQHFLALAAGKTAWAYSAPKSRKYVDVKQRFGIRPGQKVLLATLSSYDELYSSQVMGVMGSYSMLFSTQVEWMREVIAYVKQRSDLFLIIRVHPRELPNKRDSAHSTHARMLANELNGLPSNVCVNWPADGISLYDLIPQVDVGLNGWSSAGKELSMLGVPVVIYTKDILYYPYSLNILASDKAHYFKCIETALSDGWSFDRARQVYRWLAIEYTLGTVSINDKFGAKEGGALWYRVLNRIKLSVYKRFEAKGLRSSLKEEKKFFDIIMDGADPVVLQLADSPSFSSEEEMEAICRDISQLLDALYPNIPAGYSKVIDGLRGVVEINLMTIK